MITTYEFPNQWNWRIFLSISSKNEKVKDVLQHLNETENCNFDLEDDGDFIEAPCFVNDMEHLVGVICLNSYEFDVDHVMLCVHELVHLMISISDNNNCQITSKTSECWAYFMGNMIKMMLEILNQYKSDLNSIKE